MLVGVVFLVAWIVGGRQMPGPDRGPVVWLEPLVTMLAYGIAGAILIDRRPDLPFGWLLAGVAVLIAAQVLVVLPSADAIMSGNDGALARWGLTCSAFAFLPVAVQGLVNVRFPSGRPASRAGRVLEVAIVAGTVLALLGGFFGGTLTDGADGRLPALDNPLTGGTTVGAIADQFRILIPIVILLGLIAGLGVVWRFVRATGVERQQLKWRAVGVLAALATFPFAVNDMLSFLNAVDAPLFVLTLAVPVLRYRLWAIDTIVRRSLVYAVITALLVLGYLVLTAGAARMVSEQLAGPLAAAAVAISFAPLRRRVQQLVDRLFYGERSDPYRTLRELGRRLNAVPHGDVLGSLVQAVATSLRLPYTTIERPDGTVLAAHGTALAHTQRWPLAYEQQVVGFLVAAPRRGEDGFDDRDRQLLLDIADQVGVAVHAAGLTAELLASRRRLVSAREEERRRLRRDLHDGLGPVLTAVGLNLDAARARLATDPSRAERHVAEAKEATTQALTDLRRLVHGMRPPALDEVGLVEALRAQVNRLGTDSDLSVTVDAGNLPALPAAVEVAVYRIAVEAVTNAVRHSGAQHCCVELHTNGDRLVLRVRDDGSGRDRWVPGVGLTAMRERAEELGGTLSAGPGDGGSAVTATFPLPEADR